MQNVKKIVIPNSLFQIIISHAINSKPYESVSIISGHTRNKIAYADEVYTPKNIDNSTVSFTVDPLVLHEIYTDIEEKEKEIVGIYHTHPAPPKPSGTDLNYMEVNPYVWLISSTNSPDKPKGYLLTPNGDLLNIEVEIKE